jgi:hypothetical protein
MVSKTNSDESARTKRVGPPPIKPGVDYVNPEDEDQMVINLNKLNNFHSRIYFNLFLIRNYTAIDLIFFEHLLHGL